MNDKVIGIVLEKIDYKDNDEILKILTKEYGVLSFIAKGVKKITNKHYVSNFLEIEIIFDYSEHKNIFNIKNTRIINNYHKDYDLETILLLQLGNEITLNILKDSADYDFYYDNLINLYQNILDFNYLAMCFFVVNILKYEGLNPIVDKCYVCDNKKISSIYIPYGFVCQEHKDHHNEKSITFLKKFRMINLVKNEQLVSIKEYNYDFKDLTFLLEFISYNFELKLNSLKLLKELY